MGCRHRRAAMAALLAALALGAPACSRDDEPELPGACRTMTREGVRAALAEAPAAVRLGGTPLSRCLVKGSDSADLQHVGAIYLAVAQQLADAASRDPAGREALQLGYLIGAVERGAGGTQGIHYEMVRRIQSERSAVRADSAAYRRGERAGRAGG